jgi:hypothetical protein
MFIEEPLKIDLSSDDFYNIKIDSLIQRLEQIKTDHPNHKDIALTIDSGHESICVDVYGYRPETKEERQTRLNKKKASRQETRNIKIAQMKRLAKEVGITLPGDIK